MISNNYSSRTLLIAYILISYQSTLAGRGVENWKEVIDTTYKVVEKEMGSTAFEVTLAITLDVLGLYRVLRTL